MVVSLGTNGEMAKAYSLSSVVIKNNAPCGVDCKIDFNKITNGTQGTSPIKHKLLAGKKALCGSLM